jgi:hypothetical protein
MTECYPVFVVIGTKQLQKNVYRRTEGCIKKYATSEFPKKSTLQFLSIKYFRPLGIEIDLLIGHITAYHLPCSFQVLHKHISNGFK